MTCTQTVTLGAYLLGALEPPERYEFESHIAQCDSCRTELIRLAPLPGMLNQISVEDFDEGLPPGELYPTAPMPIQTLNAPAPQMLAPPPELLVPPSPPEPSPAPEEPAGPARPRRPRMYRVAVAAALVVLVAVGAVFGWGALRGPAPQPEDTGITWTATAPQTDVSANVRLLDHEWGTELQIRMANLPPGRSCYAVVYDHYGNRETAGWWGTDHDADVEIPGSTSIRRSWIDRIEFKLDDKVTFLTIKAPVR
ncbi:anti-sigma factor family protein [Actinophytocola xanthii]|uniref:Putative zinc-finger domain-containing protein n=1 Tax=Actinophytocola xanthii TaxID=1912961 RepID=A0A1Q8C5J9_9PSEU|nr:zf-HC2 domain-containing protein [Actinophytocola xanthii]OLF09620.1 hypothetical protein BU204_32780 [Actinophytocola xanthii]